MAGINSFRKDPAGTRSGSGVRTDKENRHGAGLVGVFALGVLIGISGTGVLIKNRLCISLCIMLCRAVDLFSVRCFNAGVPGS